MTVAEYNKSVEDYADRLYSFVLKNLKDPDGSNDVVQETFTKLWTRIDDVNYEKVKSYLFTTAYHTMIDQIRKENRTDTMEQVGEDQYAHNTQYSDIKEIIDAALDTLPDVQKSVIVLRDYEGYSYQEIAEITKLSEAQVKVYIYRGRMALKEKLGSIEAVI
jgi:RNA polymerase sigma factor (sigma-70 family)